MVNNTYSRHRARGTQPEIAELVDCIISVCTLLSRAFIIVDALDESEVSCRRHVLKELSRILKYEIVRVLVTGRPHIGDLESFKFSSNIQVRADSHDLRNYLETRLTETMLENVKLKEEIIDVLSTKTDGL